MSHSWSGWIEAELVLICEAFPDARHDMAPYLILTPEPIWNSVLQNIKSQAALHSSA